MKKLRSLEISRKLFWIVALGCVAVKLALCAFQLIQIFPENAPIDDELMLAAAQSIRAGEWLGPYSWTTIAKHMFFSVWLALLNLLHIPYLIGGQLLWLFACGCTVRAFAPVLPKRIARLCLFLVLWFSPYSTAAFTLRVYRDNIFPSLCLLFFAGMLGLGIRLKSSVRSMLLWGTLSGVGFGLAWLTREDGVWLLPFAVCGAAVCILAILCANEPIRRRLIRLLPLSAGVCAAAICICAYCYMNLQYYGRFVVSDFTSSEFSAVINAFKRADSDTPHKRILVCKETRQKIYDAVPEAVALGELLETPEYMHGYGDIEYGEYTSGGFCWALRRAAYDAGYAIDAQSAARFYQDLANKINAACDSGQVPNAASSASGGAFTVPYDSSFLLPTLKECGNSLRVLLLFEQCSSLAPLSYATPDQAYPAEQFTMTKSSKTAIANTADPYYTRPERLSGFCFTLITWCYRIAIFPALFFGIRELVRGLRRLFIELRHKKFTRDGLLCVLIFGILCSILLRIGIVSYMESTNYLIGTYLLYLSSAGPLILLIAGLGAACLFSESFFEKK